MSDISDNKKTQDMRLTDRTASDMVLAARKDRWEGWLYIAWGGVSLMVLAVLWAANFNIEEVTTGSAKIVPSSHEQVLQSLEGGILQELMVHEGDTVEKGQTLAKIDPTRAEASFRESANRLLALQAQAARLEAEATGNDLIFPPKVMKQPELVERETDAWKLRKRALDASIAGYVRSKALLQKELTMARELSAK
ncbi:MAG: biotin/lipoyl-binding protein, partial [Pantoea agglomerans]